MTKQEIYKEKRLPIYDDDLRSAIEGAMDEYAKQHIQKIVKLESQIKGLVEGLDKISKGEMSYHDAIKLAFSALTNYYNSTQNQQTK